MANKTSEFKNELGYVTFVYDEKIRRFAELAIEDFMDYTHIAWMSPIPTEESGITIPYPQNVFPKIKSYRVEYFSLQGKHSREGRPTATKERLKDKLSFGVVFYTGKTTMIIDFLKNLGDVGPNCYEIYLKAFDPEREGNDPTIADVCAIFYEEHTS